MIVSDLLHANRLIRKRLSYILRSPSQREQNLIGNFRLQANLARLNLPYPEAVFDIGFFKRNPRPCKSLPLDVYTFA